MNTSHWIGRLNVATNVAILLVSIALVGVLAKRYLFPTPKAEVAHSIVPGTSIKLEGVDWHASKKTLLVALRAGCSFCTESAPLYRRIVEKAPSTGVRLIALLPQPAGEGRLYLDDLKVAIADVRDLRSLSVSVGATPTLILVDNEGVVTNSWQGMLRGDKEAEVLALVQ